MSVVYCWLSWLTVSFLVAWYINYRRWRLTGKAFKELAAWLKEQSDINITIAKKFKEMK